MSRNYLPTLFDEMFDEIAPIHPLQQFFAPFSKLAKVTTGRPCGRSGINLYEDEDTVVVEAAIPGVKPEDVQVTFDRGGVTIEGKSAEEKKDVKYHIQSSSSFSYWVPLPAGKIHDKSVPDAVAKNGILTLTFQKIKEAQPIKINVKSC